MSVDLIIGKLISLLENEASSLSGVADEIREVKLLLRSIRSFLVDVDIAGTNSQTQKDWLKDVQDLAVEVEDTIDEFTYHVNKNRQWRERNQLFRIQQLQGRGSTSNYDHDHDWRKRLSEASLFFKDDDLVGIKKAQHELLGWLMDEQPQLTIISVVGMGGSGKSTLVYDTFNKQSVKQHFNFHNWITVSQQYGIKEVFRSMVKEVYKQTNEEVRMKEDTMNYRELVETLVQYLQ
ncbi:hypothetical protein PTKIN_Ptkin11bG0067700 [Pterospermum kingtungense]